MDYVILGYIGGFLTTFSIVPQLLKIFRTKSAKDLSLSWIVILVGGYVFWMAYGFGIGAYPLMIYNVFSITLTLLLLVFKIKYK